MIKIPQEDSDLAGKQEGGGGGHDDSSSNHHENKAKASASSSSFMEPKWVTLQDPRIVRVARAYGGKDRHSKVCTIRGLRDRRVRLSVPTAIQLYDLQERLRVNQPSKVIDWLLNAAKNDIDELPPLPPLNLALVDHHHHHHHHHHVNLTSNSSHQPNEEEDEEDGLEAFNNNHTFWKLIEPKEASSSHDDVKQGSRNNDNDLSHPHPHHHPSFVEYRHQREGSVAGGASEGEHASHQTDLQRRNVVPFSSTLSLSTTPADSSSHHFPSLHFGANMDMNHNNNIPSQVNYNYHHPMLMSSSTSNNLYPMFMPQSWKPFGLSMVTTTPPNNTAESHQSHNHPQNFPTK